MHVVIAGGGVAGLEALLALSALAEGLVDVELMSPSEEFVYRPLLVAEPFGNADALRIKLENVVGDAGARHTKEALLERVVSTAVETADARRLLQAAAQCPLKSLPEEVDEELLFCHVFAALLQEQVEDAQSAMPTLIALLSQLPLLYVPLAKGGDPREMVATKIRQHAIDVESNHH